MEMLHIRLNTEIHKELKAHCAINGVSMTSLIGDLIKKYLSGDKRELSKT